MHVCGYMSMHTLCIPTIHQSAVSCVHLVFLNGKIADKLMQNSSECLNCSLIYESCLAKFLFSKQVLR